MSGAKSSHIVNTKYYDELKKHNFGNSGLEKSSGIDKLIDTVFDASTVGEKDASSRRKVKQTQRYGEEAGTQDMVEYDDTELSGFGSAKSSKSKKRAYDEDERYPGVGEVNPESNSEVKFRVVDLNNSKAAKYLKKNYDLARAILNPNYDPKSTKTVPEKSLKSNGFSKRYHELKTEFEDAKNVANDGMSGYLKAKSDIVTYATELRLLHRALLLQGQKLSGEQDAFFTDQSFAIFKELFADADAPREEHIADLVGEMYEEVCGFFAAAVQICDKITKMMRLTEKCQKMASITTINGEDAYYHLPDPAKFAFLPLATRTLSHLEKMVATELCDRAEAEEWERKQTFMETLQRHLKAYRDFTENDDDDSTDAEFENEPKKRHKKEQLPTLVPADEDEDQQ